MLLGISSYTFPWAISFQKDSAAQFAMANKLLEYAHENNIGYVQFGDNLPLHTFSETELDDLKGKAKELQLNIQAGTKRLTFENVKLYISIAQRLSSPFIRVVIDDDNYHPSETDIIAVINKCLPVLKDASIVLAIENHDRFKAAALEKIILNTDKDFVGICLDSANSIGAGEGIEHIVKMLGPYTVNLHIKDFSIKRLYHKMGFIVEGSAAGEGMLDIPWLIDELDKTGRCKTATLEVWSGEEETGEKTITREKEWAEKSIRYLKNILT